MQTTTSWKSGETFETHYHQHTLFMGSTSDPASPNSGFSPKAMLLSALAGCTGIDVVSILEKMKVQFSALQIDVVTEQTDEHPRVFKDIYMTYRIGTKKINEEKVKKAVDLSSEKYCGVAAMLRKHSPIHLQIIIEEPAQ